MGKKSVHPKMSQRQAQILDIIFRLGEASVSDIMDHLPQSPTSGAVRRMLNLLYAKGIVDFKQDGAKKIYRSRVKKEVARRKTLNRVVETFFGGSAARTMASLFEASTMNLSEKEKATLYKLIEKARRQEE